MAERGLFIVLEGPDYSGKTTQAVLLKEDLESRGISVVHSREPGGTEVGEEFRALLKKDRSKLMHPFTQFLGFYGARNEYITELVQPTLDRGGVFLSDRFSPSTLVYQGYAQDVDMEAIKTLDMMVVGRRCQPDLCVILDVPAQELLRRIEADKNREKKDIFDRQGQPFMEKIRAGYLWYARTHPDNTAVVDGMLSQEVIHSQIVELVEEIGKERLYASREILVESEMEKYE